MRLIRLLCLGIPAFFLAGCVIMDSDALSSQQTAPAKPAAARPVGLNIHVALNCTPSCAEVGTDVGQLEKTIVAAYSHSRRFSPTLSDQADFVAHIKLDVERRNHWLEAKICNGSFGLLPAVWRDTVRMRTRVVSRLGMTSRSFEQQAEVDYRCHLFLAPLLPVFAESDVLDRTVTELTRRTIAQAEAEGLWRSKPHKTAKSRLSPRSM